MAHFVGTWKLEKNENYEEFLEASNLPYAVYHIISILESYHEDIWITGDNWNVNITSSYDNSRLEFKLGETFKEKTIDGRTMMSEFHMEGDKLIHMQTPMSPSNVPSSYIREILPDGRMMVTCTSLSTGVVARRFFVRTNPGPKRS